MSDESLNLSVRLFAAAKETAGRESIEIRLATGSTVADLRRELIAAIPQLSPMASSLLVAVDNAYAAETAGLSETSEVAVFPPVSGG